MCESLIWYVRVCTIWCIILYIISICCIILLNAECGIDLAVTLMKSPLSGIDSAVILWVSLSGDASIQQWHSWYHYWSMRHPVNKIHNITVSKNIWLNCEKLKKYMGTTNKERELYGLYGAALLYVFQVHSMFLR